MDIANMEIEKEAIVEIVGIWKIKDNHVVTEKNGSKLVFNETATIVWRKIDGTKTVEEIIQEMHKDYGDQNPYEHIEQIVLSCLTLFIKESLIVLKKEDLFGEWF